MNTNPFTKKSKEKRKQTLLQDMRNKSTLERAFETRRYTLMRKAMQLEQACGVEVVVTVETKFGIAFYYSSNPLTVERLKSFGIIGSHSQNAADVLNVAPSFLQVNSKSTMETTKTVQKTSSKSEKVSEFSGCAVEDGNALENDAERVGTFTTKVTRKVEKSSKMTKVTKKKTTRSPPEQTESTIPARRKRTSKNLPKSAVNPLQKSPSSLILLKNSTSLSKSNSVDQSVKNVAVASKKQTNVISQEKIGDISFVVPDPPSSTSHGPGNVVNKPCKVGAPTLSDNDDSTDDSSSESSDDAISDGFIPIPRTRKKSKQNLVNSVFVKKEPCPSPPSAAEEAHLTAPSSLRNSLDNAQPSALSLDEMFIKTEPVHHEMDTNPHVGEEIQSSASSSSTYSDSKAKPVVSSPVVKTEPTDDEANKNLAMFSSYSLSNTAVNSARSAAQTEFHSPSIAASGKSSDSNSASYKFIAEIAEKIVKSEAESGNHSCGEPPHSSIASSSGMQKPLPAPQQKPKGKNVELLNADRVISTSWPPCGKENKGSIAIDFGTSEEISPKKPKLSSTHTENYSKVGRAETPPCKASTTRRENETFALKSLFDDNRELITHSFKWPAEELSKVTKPETRNIRELKPEISEELPATNSNECKENRCTSKHIVDTNNKVVSENPSCSKSKIVPILSVKSSKPSFSPACALNQDKRTCLSNEKEKPFSKKHWSGQKIISNSCRKSNILRKTQQFKPRGKSYATRRMKYSVRDYSREESEACWSSRHNWDLGRDFSIAQMF